MLRPIYRRGWMGLRWQGGHQKASPGALERRQSMHYEEPPDTLGRYRDEQHGRA